MYHATIIENSLSDKDILKRVQIVKSRQSTRWTLHDVLVTEDQIPELSKSLDVGPWYIHLWKPGEDDVKVIFKNKIFDIQFSDKSTWADAVEHGTSLGIPAEQLDFLID
jgi:hypothetical protein